uniref:Tight junction protein ZO-1 n=1 Tax=Cacopsylla melanoneura TaxID=428564 RepID=A0A8D8RSA4_9HEMI
MKINQGGERIVWTFHDVTLNRVPGYGFGIAVSGGRDNPHFTNGDPAIAISDVLKAGPAEGKLLVNDRIMSANGLSLENVEYGTAVQVLRDSGSTVTLKVRRRIVLPASPEPQTLRVQLSKSRKKDDFGIILGNKIFVKEVTHRLDNNATNSSNQLAEGDVLLKINNHPTEGMSVKEARKLIDSSKEKLSLTIRREVPRPTAYQESTTLPGKENNYMDPLSNAANYSSQNLYVQPPTRVGGPGPNNLLEDKSNLLPRAGRSRNPLLDVSLSQLDRPVTPVNNSMDSLGPNHKRSHTLSHDSLHASSPNHHNHSRSRSDPPDPPRPPPPRNDDYYSSTRQLYDEDPLSRSKAPIPDPRFITFQKEGSVGIRLTGGNKVGIFVTAVQPGSPASLQGLQPGDKILKVNDMDMKGITREEAVLFLLSLQDQIHLIVQNRREEYEHVVASQRGDSFHIKTHFNYDQPDKGEMSFRKGDVFHVIDTLHNGVVGSWQVFRIGRNNQEVQKGIVPNKARAEELATAQFNATKKEMSASESRGSFFKRRRHSHRRSKSLSKDHWDDVVFGDSISKFPAYERVSLRHPGFVRPVVLFGPVADIARDKLLKDFPDKFSAPQLENMMEDSTSDSKKCSGIIRLSAIRDMMDRGRHGLLDITPNAVDRLNYAQFYPIVIFLRAETKQTVKELRAGVPKTAHKSSKKLLEQCQKLEKVWSHVFTGTITLTGVGAGGGPDAWYRKTRELIEKQQSSPVWISETKPDESLGDDFLFPMTSLRLSYASSPESDLEQSLPLECGGTSHSSHQQRLVKCSSDPSIATQEEVVPAYTAPPPYTPSVFKQANYDPSGKPLRTVDAPVSSPSQIPTRPGFSPPHTPHTGGGGAPPPDLPPRIDRTNKPPRTNPPRSATERLFGARGEGESNGGGSKDQGGGEAPNYINATPHRTGNTSLERHNTTRTTSSYDSVSSYEGYQRVGGGSALLGPNAHDDLKSINGDSARPGGKSHDPYRFTRSTKQPINGNSTPLPNQQDKMMKPADYPKYRPPGGGGIVEYATSKPLPPPKQPAPPPHQYKPVPPPKPKNYRPPHSYYQQATIKDTALYQSSKEYQSKDSHYSRKDSHYPEKDFHYPSKDTGLYSSKEQSLYSPNKDTLYQGGGKDYQSSKDASLYQTGKDSLYQSSKGPGSLYKSDPYSVNEADSVYGVHHGLTNGNGVPPSPSKYSTESDLNGGFDSGHGSSLDRTYDRRPPNGYYYNVAGRSNAMDLTHRADQRGSAFELYKKPSDPRNLNNYQLEHPVR